MSCLYLDFSFTFCTRASLNTGSIKFLKLIIVWNISNLFNSYPMDNGRWKDIAGDLKIGGFFLLFSKSYFFWNFYEQNMDNGRWKEIAGDLKIVLFFIFFLSHIRFEIFKNKMLSSIIWIEFICYYFTSLPRFILVDASFYTVKMREKR